ncbi:hypothetical protein L9F63_023784, partial [Diploptera punctata]
ALIVIRSKRLTKKPTFHFQAITFLYINECPSPWRSRCKVLITPSFGKKVDILD